MATIAASKPGSSADSPIREALVGYGFVLLPMGVFLLFFICPISYAIYISRYDWGILGQLKTVGWKNYSHLVHDDLFRRARQEHDRYTIWACPAQMALGLLLASSSTRVRRRGFFRARVLLPRHRLVRSDHVHLDLPAELDGSSTVFGFTDLVLRPGDGTLGRNGAERLDDVWQPSCSSTSPRCSRYRRTCTRHPRSTAPAARRTFSKITFPLLKPGHFFVAVVLDRSVA